MSLYIDLTEFLAKPTATGIQRVTGELCKHLSPEQASAVRLDSGRYICQSPLMIALIGQYFANRGDGSLSEIRRLGALENCSTVRLSECDTVLVPEVFVEQQRLAFFRHMTHRELQRYRFFIHDLIPFTHPEYFPAEFAHECHGYFQLIRRAPCCGFNSESTRDVYYSRLKRSSARPGAVFHLGADSLGRSPTRPKLNRPRAFTAIGTIEPRKNHALILEAFEPLFRQIDGLQLSFIGNVGWTEPEVANKIHLLASDNSSGFQLHCGLDDRSIRACMEQSRATIYVSSVEGYGLPPVESLWCGTPVIASTTIPSLQRLGTAGIHYVEPLDSVNLRQAVVAFLDDAYADQKAQEAIGLNLPTWQSFTNEVLRWCTQDLC